MSHSLGRVVATPAIAAAVPEAVIIGLLDRHAARDWGDLDPDDMAANDADHSSAAGQLFGMYDTQEHEIICVIKKFSAAKRKPSKLNKARAGSCVKFKERTIAKPRRLFSDEARMNLLTDLNHSSWLNQLQLDGCVSL